MRTARIVNGVWERVVPSGWIFGDRFRTTASIDALTDARCHTLRYRLADGRVVDMPAGQAMDQLERIGLLRFRTAGHRVRFESPMFWGEARLAQIVA